MSKLDNLLWHILMWSLGVASVLLAALTPRRFNVGAVDIGEAFGLIRTITLSIYAWLFFLACAVVFHYLNKSKYHAERKKVTTFWLLTLSTALLPSFSTIIVGGGVVWGSVLCIVSVYATTYFLPAPSLEWWIKEVRAMLLFIFIYGSLAAALLFPEWAWNNEYGIESSVAILPYRLFGTTNHANSLAPIAVFAWLLGRFYNCRLRWEYLHSAATLLVLFLTQSKTIWAVTALLVAIHLLKISSPGSFKMNLIYRTIGIVFLLIPTCIFAFSSYETRILTVLSDPSILTMTGRLPIWELALGIWLGQPWLGQGLDAWSEVSMLNNIETFGFLPSHAHNQLLQVLSQTGLIGLCMLLLWCLSFFIIVRRSSLHLRMSLIWLSAFFFLPGLTEVIIQYGIGSGNTLLTWLMFTTVIIVGKSNPPSESNNGVQHPSF